MRGVASRRLSCVLGVCAFALAAAGCGDVARGARVRPDLRLPPDTATLKPSDLPGYPIAASTCRICHSLDYVSLQPPRMSLAQWTAEVLKMQRAFGAPIEEGEVKLVAIYLTTVYGDAATIPATNPSP